MDQANKYGQKGSNPTNPSDAAKPYKCNSCGASFSDQNQATEHNKTCKGKR